MCFRGLVLRELLCSKTTRKLDNLVVSRSFIFFPFFVILCSGSVCFGSQPVYVYRYEISISAALLACMSTCVCVRISVCVCVCKFVSQRLYLCVWAVDALSR